MFFFMSNLDRMGDLAIVYVSQIHCVCVCEEVSSEISLDS